MQKRMSFIVRFINGISSDKEQWHGQVEHVPTGEKRPFKGVQQFLEEIEKLSNEESKKEKRGAL
jgi:hypothetical protein